MTGSNCESDWTLMKEYADMTNTNYVMTTKSRAGPIYNPRSRDIFAKRSMYREIARSVWQDIPSTVISENEPKSIDLSMESVPARRISLTEELKNEDMVIKESLEQQSIFMDQPQLPSHTYIHDVIRGEIEKIIQTLRLKNQFVSRSELLQIVKNAVSGSVQEGSVTQNFQNPKFNNYDSDYTSPDDLSFKWTNNNVDQNKFYESVSSDNSTAVTESPSDNLQLKYRCLENRVRDIEVQLLCQRQIIHRINKTILIKFKKWVRSEKKRIYSIKQLSKKLKKNAPIGQKPNYNYDTQSTEKNQSEIKIKIKPTPKEVPKQKGPVKSKTSFFDRQWYQNRQNQMNSTFYQKSKETIEINKKPALPLRLQPCPVGFTKEFWAKSMRKPILLSLPVRN